MLSCLSFCAFSNDLGEHYIKISKQSSLKCINCIQELIEKYRENYNFGTYLINMQMTPPEISPPKHKALKSDLNKHFLSVDPKASLDN